MSRMIPICLQLFAMPIQMDKANGVYFLKLLPCLIESPFDMYSKRIQEPKTFPSPGARIIMKFSGGPQGFVVKTGTPKPLLRPAFSRPTG